MATKLDVNTYCVPLVDAARVFTVLAISMKAGELKE